MNRDESITVLITYRMEQAQQSIKDAEGLISVGASPQSIINRSYIDRSK